MSKRSMVFTALADRAYGKPRQKLFLRTAFVPVSHSHRGCSVTRTHRLSLLRIRQALTVISYRLERAISPASNGYDALQFSQSCTCVLM